MPVEIRKLIAIAENGRTPEEMRTLMTYFRTLDMAKHAVGGLGNPLAFVGAAHASALAFRIDAERELAELKKVEPNIVTSLVMQERKSPRKTNVMIQGDFTRKGVEVDAGHAVRPRIPRRMPNRKRIDSTWRGGSPTRPIR